jgi:inner membrane protein
MFGVRHRVNDRVLASMSPAERAGVVDVVLNPRPANPLCWNALAIVRDESADEYRLTRGRATSFGAGGCGEGRAAPVVWDEPVRQSLRQLRALDASDCSVRAWLQFGRAPVIDERAIGDLRFGGTSADNFSMMPLSPAGPGACPPNPTAWTPPRADLLRPTER